MDNQRQDPPSQIDQVRRQSILTGHEGQIFCDFTGIERRGMNFENVRRKNPLRGLPDDC
jgi:hypothetical protein